MNEDLSPFIIMMGVLIVAILMSGAVYTGDKNRKAECIKEMTIHRYSSDEIIKVCEISK